MKTKTMGIALLSAAALLGGTAAQADLPWTYGEIGYSRADGVENFKTDAFDLKASIGFLGMWHASLDYLNGTSEQGSQPDQDFDGFDLVVGAHHQLTANTQLITDLTYFNYDLDGGEGSDGYGIGLGLRHGLTDKVELMAEVWYTEGSFDNNSTSNTDYNNTTIEVGARYNWLPSLSTGLTVNLDGGRGSATANSSGSGDAARFDVRWSFGDLF